MAKLQKHNCGVRGAVAMSISTLGLLAASVMVFESLRVSAQCGAFVARAMTNLK